MTQERNGTDARDDGPGAVRRTVRVVNPRGLHHRIADVFSRTARGFASTVTLWNGDTRADGKELWDLLLLVVLPDTDVVLEVEGPDAAAAVEPLTDILASPGGEEYTI
jgi:phosphotransferase system HPr (HPr) family protein